MRSPGYVGECIFWPSLNDSEKFLTISIFPGAIGGRFGQEPAFWPLPRASLSNDDNGHEGYDDDNNEDDDDNGNCDDDNDNEDCKRLCRGAFALVNAQGLLCPLSGPG